MEVKEASPYLPKGKIRNLISRLKTSIAYRVWKKKLRKYGRLGGSSQFKILEVGCGPGYFLMCVERWFPESEPFGLDNDASLIQFARLRLKRTKLSVHDGHQLPFQDSSFDVVCSLQVVEHIEKPEKFFLEAQRILKKDGFLIIATPNPMGIPARILGDKWQGYRYDHISLKPPYKWREVISSSGFIILQDGTTGITGFRILRLFPFALINWIPMVIYGFFPWYQGESYMVIAKKG